MASRKDKYIKSNFLKDLKPSGINLKDFEELNKPGFNLEECVNGYRVYSLRQEDGKHRPSYTITVFNGPEPRDILSSRRFNNFKEMLEIRKSALAYIKDIK